VKAPAMLYPTLIEKQFANDSEQFGDALRAYVLEEFVPELRGIAARVERERTDDANLPGDGHWSSDIQRALRRLKNKADEIAATSEPLADAASFKVEQWTNKEILKLEKLLPADYLAANKTGYNPENIRNSLRKAWSKNYAGLITAVTDETVAKVGRIVYEGFAVGESYKSIEKKIISGGPIEALKNPPFNTARKRSRLIARDQIGKLNGKLIEKRQTQLGIDSYIWRTSLDERVRGNPSGRYPNAVPSHYGREGKVYKWDTPPEGGHPGEAILCRCTAEPYIEGVTGEQGAAGVTGKTIGPAQSLGAKIENLRTAAAAALNLASNTAGEAIRALSTAETAAKELEDLVDGIVGIEDELDELAKKAATVKLNEKLKQAEAAKAAAAGLSGKAQKAKAAAEKVNSAKAAGPAAKAQAAAALSHVENIEKTLEALDNVLAKAVAAKAAAEDKLAKALAIKKAKAAALEEAEDLVDGLEGVDAAIVKSKFTKGEFDADGEAFAKNIKAEAAAVLSKLKKGGAAFQKAESMIKDADYYLAAKLKSEAAKLAALSTANTTADAALASKYGVNAAGIKAVDASEWTYKSPKQGSNPGGIYEDKAGARYIVKVMDEEHAINELLASKLYKAAGVHTSDMMLVEGVNYNGKPTRALAGRWIDGLESGVSELKSAKTGPGGFIDGAGVDMWLANWDSVGLTMDNILKDTAGNLVRIDVGAAMKFRAQGQKKPFEAGKVPELETYLNGVNDQITPILSKYSADDITRSLEKVANFTDETIDDILDTVWKGSTLPDKTREEYREALKGRRDVIRAEWEKRDGPKLSGAALPGAIKGKAPKPFDPFDDYKPGDAVPFLSPEKSDHFLAKYKSNGKTTMKNALEANGLESDKNLVTYPDDVIEDVKEWMTKADKAIEGGGPFPKPLDLNAISKKIKAAEDAKIAAAKLANKATAEGLNKMAADSYVKADELLEKAIDELYTVEKSDFLTVKNNAEKALAIATDAKETAEKAAKLGYEEKAVIQELQQVIDNAEAVLSSPEYIAIKKKAGGDTSAKARTIGAITAKEKEERRKELGRDNTNPAAAFVLQEGKPLAQTAEGFRIVFADDKKYAKDLVDAGVQGADGYQLNRGDGKKRWVSMVKKKIEGPWTKGSNRDYLERDGVPWDKYGTEKDAHEVLRDYTGGSYGSRNNYLRGISNPNPLTAAKLDREHKAAAELIRQHTVKEPLVVWRGGDTAFLNSLLKQSGKKLEDLVGTVYTEHAFMSTTTTHRVAFEGGTLFRLNVPKGAKAIPARHISQITGEDEIIFPPTTRFYISDIQNIDSSHVLHNGRHNRVITVEILPEE